jgi:hypothetical protein
MFGQKDIIVRSLAVPGFRATVPRSKAEQQVAGFDVTLADRQRDPPVKQVSSSSTQHVL